MCVAVLTTGDDAPGINAGIRAAVRTGIGQEF
jgi:6-phosphofructokinase